MEVAQRPQRKEPLAKLIICVALCVLSLSPFIIGPFMGINGHANLPANHPFVISGFVAGFAALVLWTWMLVDLITRKSIKYRWAWGGLFLLPWVGIFIYIAWIYFPAQGKDR